MTENAPEVVVAFIGNQRVEHGVPHRGASNVWPLAAATVAWSVIWDFVALISTTWRGRTLRAGTE